ncbi:tripartite tricarboxylate transporter TctB family protein [Geminicoccus roseus]|uniref:tripartite tricarboxylate transporter TctB family protein n=1 Tax=Geminicoccus roseus TaxID=404900 RepID=UPI0004120820|nr:tripartite tricarboxylate transporter TctB family protein [Geminicoccus roseus]
MSDRSDQADPISPGLTAVILTLTTVYLAASFWIRPQFSEGFAGPRFLPTIAALLVYAALGFQTFATWRSRRATALEGSLKQPAIVVAVTALYILVFGLLGYLLSTFAYVLALFAVFGFEKDRTLWRIGYAVLVTALFYALFAGAFGIRLPKLAGWL